MKSDKCSRKNRRGYHHGNLREALVQVAERLILEKGPGGFTLVEAATRAGVSPAAPYRHFKNREALLAEVARAGFERFADRLQEAWDEGRPDPLTAFRRMGDVYMDFSRYERASYVAMFESDLASVELPELQQQGERAFKLLTHACSRLGARNQDGSPADPERMGAHIWALSHGIASLFSGERGGKCLDQTALRDLFHDAATTYLRGLEVDA